MKLNFLQPIGISVFLSAFVACTDDISEVQSGELKQIVMTASDFESETGSRTNFKITSAGAEFSWAANDTVGIFPNEGAQAYFPMTSGAGTKSANFTGGGWALKDASTYAAYYPFIGDFYLNKNAIPVDYTGQVQIGDASTAHLGAYDFMAAVPSTPKNGNVNFAFKHLGALVQLKLTVPEATTLTSVTLTTESNDFSVKGTVDIMASSLGITPVTSTNEITLEIKDITTTKTNQVVTLYMMIPPTDLSNKTLNAVVKTNINTKEVTLGSKNFQAGKAYALNGSLEDKTNFERTVKMETAGTMKQLLGNDYLNIESLKIVGPINGDDVYYLRKMLGANSFSKADWGKLTTLDLSETTIVEGGDWYYDKDISYKGNEYYTSNNTIGNYMFFECFNLQNIVLPQNTILINEYSFCNCDALKSIIIPNNVISTGNHAFRNCDALTDVTILSGNVGEEDYNYTCTVFGECKSLTSLTIGDDVTSIGGCAFNTCENLTSVTIGNGVEKIGEEAFGGTSIKNVYIKELESWCKIDFYSEASNPLHNGGSLYLRNKLLTELQIPENITEIKKNAFVHCRSITDLILPNGTTLIGTYAFKDCDSLISIAFGNGVKTIKSHAFYDCDMLTNIVIPDNVTSLEESHTFADCDVLASVVIGNKITKLGDYTFENCILLNKIAIGENVTNTGIKTFNNCPLSEVHCYSVTPPSISIDFNLNKITEEATLYVPTRCGTKYRSSKWGNYFKNIVEMD